MSLEEGRPQGLSDARRRLLLRLADRRGRPREAAVLVEGPRALQTALEAGARVRFVLVTDALAGSSAPLLRTAEAGGVPVIRIEEEELAAVAATRTPQGVLAVADEPRAALPPEAGGERVLVLDAVQDPGNAGALIRAAVAFGASRILALDGTVDTWNPKSVRAAAGLSFRLPLHRVSVGEALDWLRECGIPLLLADAAGRDVRTVAPPGDPEGGWALAIGNEGAGAREEVRRGAQAVVSLPLAPGVESLNAAMAGTVLLWVLGPGRPTAGGSA